MTVLNDTTQTLAERMRMARLMAGYEQADMARELGVARTTVSAWERGLTEPSATNFVRWAEILGQPLEWLAQCARRDSNSQPSDLYSIDPVEVSADALDVELQMLLIVEGQTRREPDDAVPGSA